MSKVRTRIFTGGINKSKQSALEEMNYWLEKNDVSVINIETVERLRPSTMGTSGDYQFIHLNLWYCDR